MYQAVTQSLFIRYNTHLNPINFAPKYYIYICVEPQTILERLIPSSLGDTLFLIAICRRHIWLGCEKDGMRVCLFSSF